MRGFNLSLWLLTSTRHSMRALAFAVAWSLTLASMSASAQSTPTVRRVNVAQSRVINSPSFSQCVFMTQGSEEGRLPPARLTGCTYASSQQWFIEGDRTSGFMIKLRDRPDLCLDVDIDHTEHWARVSRWKCSTTYNAYQRWNFVPIKRYQDALGASAGAHYLIFNVALMQQHGKNPLVLTAPDKSAELIMQLYVAANGLPPMSQTWRSQEIWCALSGKHANGTLIVDYSVGGYTSHSETPDCM